VVTILYRRWHIRQQIWGNNVLQDCWIVLHCVTVWCSVLQELHSGDDDSDNRSQYCELQYIAVCCSVLQYVAVCCSVLQCVAVCCSMLQYVAVCCRSCIVEITTSLHTTDPSIASWSVLQCVAVCCSVMQELNSRDNDVASHNTSKYCELQSVAICCSVLQCVAVCCSVFQCFAQQIWVLWCSVCSVV